MKFFTAMAYLASDPNNKVESEETRTSYYMKDGIPYYVADNDVASFSDDEIGGGWQPSNVGAKAKDDPNPWVEVSLPKFLQWYKKHAGNGTHYQANNGDDFHAFESFDEALKSLDAKSVARCYKAPYCIRKQELEELN